MTHEANALKWIARTVSDPAKKTRRPVFGCSVIPAIVVIYNSGARNWRETYNTFTPLTGWFVSVISVRGRLSDR